MEAKVEQLEREVGNLRDWRHTRGNESQKLIAQLYTDLEKRSRELAKEIARDEVIDQLEKTRGRDFSLIKWIVATTIAVIALGLSIHNF